MIPTIVGRIQTRILLVLTLGNLVTFLWSLLFNNYYIPFLILYINLILGIALDFVYNFIQDMRWDRDWPPILAFIGGIVEGVVLWLVINYTPLADVFNDKVALINFLLHYISVFVSTFCTMLFFMNIFFPKWRYNGGKIVF
jgi:hypothetical protein